MGIIKDIVANYFTVQSIYTGEKEFYFIVCDYNRNNFLQLIEDLDKIGYLPFIEEYDSNYRINIVKKPEHGKSRVHINVILFLATFISTVFAWPFFGGGSLIEGIEFSLAILAIIGTHETAHYFAAKKHGIKATLPYFIPAPTLIGTFGAVINVKSAIPHKNALFDLGASGPVAGIIVTIPVLVTGLYFSDIIPIQTGSSIIFYPSLLMGIIEYFIGSGAPAGYYIQLNPLILAAWVGIIVTMINLMPVAFLDGGHISRSLFNGKIHQIISVIGIGVTIFLGWIPMAILMAIIMFMSRKHPGALDNVSKISKNRKIIAVLVVIIFILCLSPAPFIAV
ncbi:MAG: site-2 protease family protein [Methanobacterium sp.]